MPEKPKPGNILVIRMNGTGYFMAIRSEGHLTDGYPVADYHLVVGAENTEPTALEATISGALKRMSGEFLSPVFTSILFANVGGLSKSEIDDWRIYLLNRFNGLAMDRPLSHDPKRASQAEQIHKLVLEVHAILVSRLDRVHV